MGNAKLRIMTFQYSNEYKKLSCRRETARRFVSLNILYFFLIVLRVRYYNKINE